MRILIFFGISALLSLCSASDDLGLAASLRYLSCLQTVHQAKFTPSQLQLVATPDGVVLFNKPDCLCGSLGLGSAAKPYSFISIAQTLARTSKQLANVAIPVANLSKQALRQAQLEPSFMAIWHQPKPLQAKLQLVDQRVLEYLAEYQLLDSVGELPQAQQPEVPEPRELTHSTPGLESISEAVSVEPEQAQESWSSPNTMATASSASGAYERGSPTGVQQLPKKLPPVWLDAIATDDSLPKHWAHAVGDDESGVALESAQQKESWYQSHVPQDDSGDLSSQDLDDAGVYHVISKHRQLKAEAQVDPAYSYREDYANDFCIGGAHNCQWSEAMWQQALDKPLEQSLHSQPVSSVQSQKPSALYCFIYYDSQECKGET